MLEVCRASHGRKIDRADIEFENGSRSSVSLAAAPRRLNRRNFRLTRMQSSRL